MKYCSKCGKEHVDEAVICVGCGCAFEKPAKPAATPMKWYKFLINFLLIVMAVNVFISGVSKVCTSTFLRNTDSENFLAEYFEFEDDEYFNEVNVVNIVYGAILCVTALPIIVTRQKLAKYKHTGPLLLYIMCGVEFIYTFLYEAACYIATEDLVLDACTRLEIFSLSDLIWSLISTAVIIWLNYIYFNKRRDLFIN